MYFFKVGGILFIPQNTFLKGEPRNVGTAKVSAISSAVLLPTPATAEKSGKKERRKKSLEVFMLHSLAYMIVEEAL